MMLHHEEYVSKTLPQVWFIKKKESNIKSEKWACPEILHEGGAQFPVSVSNENIDEDPKKIVLHVFRRPIYHPK